MKKTKLFPKALALLIAIILCGCQPAAASASPSPSATNDTSPASDTAFSLKYMSSDICSVTEQGYYFLQAQGNGASTLSFFDLATKQTVVVCNRAECSHQDDTCSAWLGSGYTVPMIVAYKSGIALIYAGNPIVHDANPQENTAHIITMEFNGADRKTIKEYDAAAMFSSSFAVDGDFLYYQIETVSGTKDGGHSYSRIEKIDLSTGQTQEIIDFGDTVSFFADAYDSKIIYKELTLPAGSEFGNGALYMHTIYVFDLESGSTEAVFSWNQSEVSEFHLPHKMLYINDTNEIHAFNFDSKADSILVGSELLNQYIPLSSDEAYASISLYPQAIVEEYLLLRVTAIAKDTPQSKDFLLAIDLTGKDVKEILLTTDYGDHTQPLEISANFGDQLLVTTAHTQKSISISDVKGNTTSFAIFVPTYSLISAADLLANNANYTAVN